MSAFARRTLLFLITRFASESCIARSAHDIQIRRNGGKFSVSADVMVAANPRIAWQVLADYDHPADFVPDMESRMSDMINRTLRQANLPGPLAADGPVPNAAAPTP